ncbi:non-ribosomal peptide synthetase [Streptomyces sp. NRRL S-31]|uniref:non-ribosomal peptide synthetase n=1 Tax=Streptomyces sp. NRRL S-31 TaxID=1463898 RepID=UPI0004CC43CA|nr:non-ribosomal peptide synthetase [Streptomyces sp. NRRL S-31]
MSHSTIHGLIAARARSNPDLPAVEYGTEHLDFSELERRSDAAARRLSAHGVEPGVFVAVALERSAAMVVTLLGILKAGGSYVALDPAHPEARLRWILRDIAPRVAVASRAVRDAVPATGIPLLVAEELAEAPGPGTAPGTAPETAGTAPVAPAETAAGLPEGDPDRLAFVTYTSGTTGRPKGVMAVHDSIAYFMGMISPYLGLGPGTRFLQFYPLTWETQALDIYAVLAAGGTVVIPPAGTETAGPGLVRFLRDARVTGAMLPPALLAELTEEPPLPALHTLAYIGERCQPRTAERWGSGRRLVNLYGPTEVTVAASASDERPPGDAPPIGKALPGRELHVLDEHMRPVAPGEPGELYVGGRGLARGYWNLPELTERQFPPDPFSGRPGARLYRTGDRVRYLPDGNLDFLGRVDGQLNVRGQRVERGEVESVMAAHPGVRSCAVVVQGEGPDARLVGFVVGPPGIEKELADRLAEELPPVMVPSFIVPLERLPLNQHGKVDLTALRAYRPRESGSRTAGSAPEPGAQAELARIWEDVLGVAGIGPGDGFRALGGTSLQAIRVQNRVREHFGVVLTVRELLGAGTLAELARILAAGGGERAALPPLTRTDTDSGTSHPASLHQRRLWAQARMKRAASVAYNEASALQVTGPVDLPALRRAVQDLADRHEAFRSSLHLEGADLRVDVAPRVTVDLAEEDLTGSADPLAEATRRVTELGAVPFDLERAPLLRATLLTMAAEERVLVLVTHHTVADGLSQDVLDRDLAECYAARRAGREPAPRPRTALRPRDHARWQRATAGHPVLAAGLDHWRSVLAGAPTETHLPTLGPRPASFSHLGGRVDRGTGPGLRAAVRRLAEEAGTTGYAVCLLALALLVSRRTGQRDVLIGSPFSGRPSQEAEDVIGFFTNTVVMRVTLDGTTDPLPLLAAVDERVQEGLEHQYVAFNDVVRAVGARAGASGQPLVQVVLAYQGPLRPRAALEGTRVVPWLVDNGTAKADLTVEINEVGDELVVVLPYSADVMDLPTARSTLAEYLDILRELTAARTDDTRS